MITQIPASGLPPWEPIEASCGCPWCTGSGRGARGSLARTVVNMLGGDGRRADATPFVTAGAAPPVVRAARRAQSSWCLLSELGAYQGRVHEVLGEEPCLAFAGADHLGDQQVVGAVVAGLVGSRRRLM